MKISRTISPVARHVLFVVAILVMLIVDFLIPSYYAAGDEASLEPGAVQVVRREASAGSTLRWDWSASSVVAFSVSRAGDAQTILYAAQGTHDTGSLAISADDTYLLLWTNIDSQLVNLTFSASVDAGSGQIMVILLAVLLVMVTLTVSFILVTRRDRARRSERIRPPSLLGAFGILARQGRTSVSRAAPDMHPMRFLESCLAGFARSSCDWTTHQDFGWSCQAIKRGRARFVRRDGMHSNVLARYSPRINLLKDI